MRKVKPIKLPFCSQKCEEFLIVIRILKIQKLMKSENIFQHRKQLSDDDVNIVVIKRFLEAQVIFPKPKKVKAKKFRKKNQIRRECFR